MSQIIKETRIVDDSNDRVVRDDDRVTSADGGSMAAKIVYLITGIIVGLLAFRFLLSLLGANRENGFADFIYSLSYPFAAPFFGLFNYSPAYGTARFEIETLFAIAVFAIVGSLIVYALNIGKNRRV